MDSSVQVQDDTIRDSFETGYVATRPRFTRGIRSWNVNVRNLQAEDIRALDYFSRVTVARGSNAFYYPNLLPNSSFEFPAEWPDELFAHWYPSIQSGASASAGAPVLDGKTALLLSITPGVLAVGGYVIAKVQSRKTVSVQAGDVYTYAIPVVYSLTGTLPSGTGHGAGLAVSINYADGSSSSNSYFTGTPGTGYAVLSGTFTIPSANASGSAPVSMDLALYMDFRNGSASSITFASAPASGAVTLSAAIDGAGVALSSAANLYGQTVGSEPIPALVRFSESKIPQVSDLGWIGGIKRYGATFGLAEV